MRNAIPFKAEVVLTLPKENVESLKQAAKEWEEEFVDEYKTIESGIEMTVEDVDTPATEMPEEIQDNVLDAILACHNGVLRMIPVYPDVVETSSNLAIIDIEDGKAAIKILARSSREDMKSQIVTQLASCFSMAGMKVETAGTQSRQRDTPSAAEHLQGTQRRGGHNTGRPCRSGVFGDTGQVSSPRRSVARPHHAFASHHVGALLHSEHCTLLGTAEDCLGAHAGEIMSAKK